MEEQQFMVWFGVRNGMLWHCGPEIMVDDYYDGFHGRIISGEKFNGVFFPFWCYVMCFSQRFIRHVQFL